MADDKKKGAKPAAPAGAPGIEAEIIFALFIAVAFLFIALPSIFSFFDLNVSVGSSATHAWDSVQHFFSKLFSTVLFLSLFSCLIFGMGIVYAKFRLKEVMDHFTARLAQVASGKPLHPTFQHTPQGGVVLPGAMTEEGTALPPVALPVHPRWLNIEENMKSSNSADWRLAILEADIMLFDMLDQMGLQGQTIADKLKAANQETFITLQDAWRAHKVRNIIAHEGASFQLSRSQAEETIRQYKKVFDEFYFI